MTTAPILWFLTLVFLSNAPSNTLQQELGSVFRLCYDSTGNYTPNTPYQANLLTTLLPSLASNVHLNTVHVRGHHARLPYLPQPVDCRHSPALPPPQAGLHTIRELHCPLFQPILRHPGRLLPLLHYRNTANATEPAQFSSQVGGLTRNLSMESAQSPSRFAARRTSHNDLSDMYGMTQCTRDISSSDCFTCLKQARGSIGNEIGARIYSPSCSLRLLVYAF